MKPNPSIGDNQNPSGYSIATALRRCFIQFPHVKNLLGQMEALLSQDTTVEEADNLLLIGEPGVGKSCLLTKLCIKHPKIQHADFSEIPILYASVPSKSSIDDLASAMLLSMGSPFWNRGKTKELTHQLKTLLKTCKVRMIILDEVNHLVDKGGIKTHHLIADWLKELSDDVRIPIVLAGIPRVTRLLETNDQLRSRFREVVTITPFSVETEQAIAEFRGVLRAFKVMIPDLLQVDITSTEMAHRFAFASSGRLREIRRLMVRVVELACKEKSGCATLRTFSMAFQQVIFPDAPDKRNPFTDKFDQTPLTRPGEPFAPRAEG